MKKLIFAFCLCAFTYAKAQRPIAQSPIELFGDHIFLKLSVDGSQPMDFIFDTGDGLTVLDTDAALQLDLPLDHSKTEESAQGTIEGKLIRHNYIEMEGVRLEDDIEIYATDLSHLEEHIGKDIDGIIGYDLLEHYVVNLDYSTMSIRIYDPEEYKYTSIGDKFELNMHKRIPHIECSAMLMNGEVLTGDYFLITGAGTTVDFNTKFADKNDLLEKTGNHYSYLVKGIGDDEYLHHEGRVKQFRFGKITYDNLPIGISEVEDGVQANRKMDGIIGNRILKNYNLMFNYEEEALYLERHPKSSKEFPVNGSGIEVQLNESGRVVIHRIYEDTEAASENMQVGDRLLSIDGKSVDNLTLPEVRTMLRAYGQTVTLQLEAEGSEKEVRLKIKKLI